ncbi:hypothetical protein BD289DRAFT_441133 [Coniella lustricola]|uniref:Uncharacterized protein n=1 Tax=Coniella lustricola TaxID=2025994 RepID=A0A2T2ZZR5_9PEZI|nr:hypothetical protein BD289DRAFT_441133 [Coniella lustricola]
MTSLKLPYTDKSHSPLKQRANDRAGSNTHTHTHTIMVIYAIQAHFAERLLDRSGGRSHPKPFCQEATTDGRTNADDTRRWKKRRKKNKE